MRIRHQNREDRCHRPGQDRPAARRPVRLQGHDVVGVDVNQTPSSTGQRRHASRSPVRRTCGEARRARAGRARCARPPTTPRPCPAPTPSWSSCRCSSTTRRRARLRLDGHRDRRLAAAPHARHPRRPTRPPCRSAPPAPGGSRCSRRAPGSIEGTRLPPGLLPRAGAHRPRLRGPAQVPQARRRPLRGRRGQGRRVLRGGARLRRAPRPRAAATASGTSARPRPPSWPSSPRPPTATSTSASPTSSPASPPRPASTSTRSSRPRNSQPYSHIHRPGIAVGGHCIPVYPRLYLWNDPRRDRRPRRPRGERRRCPTTPSACSRAPTATWPAPRVVVLGAAYRGGVKETAFSGVFAAVDALRDARRAPCSCTTRCTPTRSSSKLGFDAVHLGEPGRCGRRPGRPRRVPGADARPTCPGMQGLHRRRRISSADAWDGRHLPRHRQGLTEKVRPDRAASGSVERN